MTVLLPQTRTAPIGAKSNPMRKRVGRTLLGVRMGCQALRRCCLKAVSVGTSSMYIVSNPGDGEEKRKKTTAEEMMWIRQGNRTY